MGRVSPWIYGGDTGELIASSHLLGVPHAPGYPTYVVIGKAAQVLVPFGNLSLRSNYLSAALAASSLVMVYWLFQKVFKKNAFSWEALAAATILGLSPIFVDQALSAEVFTLNFVFFLGVLLCLTRSEPQGFIAASFIFGLGMGNHHTLMAATPFLAWAFWKEAHSLKTFFHAGLFFTLGLTVYLILPLRAHAGPAVNFGDPETWGRFWAVVTRKEFGSLSLHPAAVPFRDIALLILEAKQFLARTQSQLGNFGIVLALGGVGTGFIYRESRWVALAALLGWLGVGFGFEILSNLSPGSDIGQWRLERFFIFPLFSLVTALALFAFWTNSLKRWGRAAGFIVAILFVMERAFAFPMIPTLRDNFVFRDVGLSLLRSAPVSSRLVIDRILFDEPTSAIVVLTQIEKKREDIKIFYRPGTLFEPVYGADVLELSWPDRYQRQHQIEEKEFSSKNNVRCLAFEKSNTPFAKPALSGLLYQEKGEGPLSADADPFFLFRSVLFGDRADYPRRLIAVHIPYLLGKRAGERGDWDLARKWLGMAQRIGGKMAWLASNIGGVYAHGGLLEDAKNCYLEATRWDPYFPNGYFGLGYTSLQQNNLETAIEAYAQAVRTGPDLVDAYYMLGVAHVMAGQFEKAREPWMSYLEIAPQGAQALVIKKKMEELWK